MESRQTPYSTLEVNEQANHQEELLKSQNAARHGTAAEESPHVLPQVGANPEDYPEATHPEPGNQFPSRGKDNNLTICGLRKKKFWILFIIFVVVVVGAAVGGAIGGTLGQKDSSPSSSSRSDSSSDSSSSPSKTTFLPNTYLAAVNYTENAIIHHRVFFQTMGDGIYQSAWNSSGRAWMVSPVNAKDSDLSRAELFKTPTPISTSFYACSSNVSLNEP